jgi:hypothetical protein
MDTEKHYELQKQIKNGGPPSDEGPYYHKAWWESYKGSVKGKLLGLTLGVLGGALVGAVVVAAASLLPGLAALGAAGALMTVGAFAATGMMYGMHEFSEIGKGVGNTATQFNLLEQREKTLMKAQTAELKEEIGKLKAELKGESYTPKEENIAAMAAAKEQDENYRKAHYAKINPPKINTFAFWKVALIGLAVGAAAGALIGATGLAAVALHGIIELTPAVATAGSALVFGAMGATFGLNRDFARKIADMTDLLFKGIVGGKSADAVRTHQQDIGKMLEEKYLGNKPQIATAVMPDYGIEYPISETHHRDKVLPAAQRALLGFDHTRATPH